MYKSNNHPIIRCRSLDKIKINFFIVKTPTLDDWLESYLTILIIMNVYYERQLKSPNISCSFVVSYWCVLSNRKWKDQIRINCQNVKSGRWLMFSVIINRFYRFQKRNLLHYWNGVKLIYAWTGLEITLE